MRVPLAEVMAWPERHVRLQLAFMAKEPTPEDQIILALAQLSALVDNRSRGSAGTTPATAMDYLPFADPWKVEEGPAQSTVTAEELQMFSHLASSKSQPA